MNVRGILPVVLVLVALLISGSVYTVDQREVALRFQFSRLVETNIQPGLHFKWPWINTVRKFPSTILTRENPQELFLTQEKKNLLVDFFVKWRIVDFGEYYKANRGDEALAAQRLIEIVKDGMRSEFAKRTVPQVVSAERRELLDDMLARARANASGLGIAIVDVRVKRTEFPDEVSESVYARMRQERARVASELRAEGAEAAEKIRAEADRHRTVTLAEAYGYAEKGLGAGDAEAAGIYARAYQKDPEFFAFYRAIQAYRKSMGKDNDLLVLGTDSEFFRYMEKPQPAR